LAEHRLLVQPKRAYHKTLHSFHRFYRHPNLLKPGPEKITAGGTGQVLVADITYLPAKSGPLYLSLVTDAYSRKIVGHHVHEGMHAESAVMAQSAEATAWQRGAYPSLGPRRAVLLGPVSVIA
jgi:transposase InsO family protein